MQSVATRTFCHRRTNGPEADLNGLSGVSLKGSKPLSPAGQTVHVPPRAATSTAFRPANGGGDEATIHDSSSRISWRNATHVREASGRGRCFFHARPRRRVTNLRLKLLTAGGKFQAHRRHRVRSMSRRRPRNCDRPNRDESHWHCQSKADGVFDWRRKTTWAEAGRRQFLTFRRFNGGVKGVLPPNSSVPSTGNSGNGSMQTLAKPLNIFESAPTTVASPTPWK